MRTFLPILLASLWPNLTAAHLAAGQSKAILCYFGSWSTYRWASGHFDVEDIDPYLCTHLAFGFAGLDENSNTIKVLDPYNELEENWGKGAFRRFTNLKLINPNLKTLLAVGGWNEGATKYSKMISNPSSRAKFVESALNITLSQGFDGLDMDWEYPGGREDSPGDVSDKENFIALLRELRAAFQPHNMMLTAAVSAGKHTIDRAYDVPQMSQYLDFINVMAYDFHGWWANHSYTGHNSPLYALPEEEEPNHVGKYMNADFAMRYWIQLGAKPEQLLLGMAAYGRGFTLEDPDVNGFYAPASGGIDKGPYTATVGFWGYNEYCEKMQTERDQWTITRNKHVVAPVAVSDRKWFAFDDEESIRQKSQYVLDMGLGGGMVWSIDTDDFRGFCSGTKFPLLNVMAKILTNGPQTPPPDWTPPSVESTTKAIVTHSPVDPNNELCEEDGGIKPDPEDQTKYYECVLGVDGQWSIIHETCPSGLVFNPVILVCDWPHKLERKAFQLRDEPVNQGQLSSSASFLAYVSFLMRLF